MLLPQGTRYGPGRFSEAPDLIRFLDFAGLWSATGLRVSAGGLPWEALVHRQGVWDSGNQSAAVSPASLCQLLADGC